MNWLWCINVKMKKLHHKISCLRFEFSYPHVWPLQFLYNGINSEIHFSLFFLILLENFFIFFLPGWVIHKSCSLSWTYKTKQQSWDCPIFIHLSLSAGLVVLSNTFWWTSFLSGHIQNSGDFQTYTLLWLFYFYFLF